MALRVSSMGLQTKEGNQEPDANMEKKVKTGADLFIEALQKQNVEIIFGYPGGAALPIYDALYKNPIRHILTRHEQGAIHAAEGYARVTGKPGVVIATSGPGATNLVTGIADAMMDSLPLVIFTGQVGSSVLGTDAFQESDIVGITMPITKHNYQVKKLKTLEELLKKHFISQLPEDLGQSSSIFLKILQRISLSLIQKNQFIYLAISQQQNLTIYNYRSSQMPLLQQKNRSS